MALTTSLVGLLALPLLSLTYYFQALPQIPLVRTGFSHANEGRVITPELSAFIEETLSVWNISGLSVAVIPKDGEPELRSWGIRTEEGESVTPDTLFHMASVSKAFCASAIGILMDDFANGRNVTALPPGLSELTWKTKVKDILPGQWELMDEWATEKANIHDILSHVSGLPRHDYSYGPYDTPFDAVVRMKYLRPAFELREKWSYNNQMFMVGAHIIATYSGMPYTTFVSERIFSPLGMSSTTFSPGKAERSGHLTQGWTRLGRRLPEWFTEDIAELKAGPGGVISSAVDMSRWVSLWLNEGVHKNETVLPKSVYQTASAAYSVSAGTPADSGHSIGGYGMGWFRSSYLGHDVVYHSGAIPGFSTLVSFLPSDNVGVVVFANGGDRAAPVTSISEHILDEALHLRESATALTPTPDESEAPRRTINQSSTSNITVALEDYAGRYVNPGYGSFTLCSPSSDSSYCSQVKADFATVDAVTGISTSVPQLLAQWPRVWSSHIRMAHVENSVFVVEFTSLFPNGYGIDSTPFETAEIGTSEARAQFFFKDGKVSGFGIFGLVREVTEREKSHDTVQDKAEVWFDRV
ncbi:beta-lactamase/transpeptidase-like protein [Hygrophoropsis aurantiaca]|uniref:Beta-lactamase/transpeptidase-like protein n=1 Tax=Hygrophoropsis aurantiaca TaxID=72124 RepID=A0ACB8AM32_9AGAM|nr:beta-lactamase/transpeptidase-like protein [Hygrophoropsis aurantiaca]